MDVKDRLLKFVDYTGLNVSQFEKSVGVSNGSINNIRSSIGSKNLTKIKDKYPELNKVWLLHGEGEMIINEPEKPYTIQRRDGKNTKQIQRNKVPLYDNHATASNIGTDMTPIHAPAGTIDVGDLLHDSSAALRIYRNSMLPNYPPGCVVGLVKKSTGFIQPGEVYVLETAHERMLKRLFYSN